MALQQKFNALTGLRAVKALQKRGVESYYCETRAEALEKTLSLIPYGSTVAWGGSQTIEEIGLTDRLKTGDFRVIDRDAPTDPEEKRTRQLEALSADYFFMSSNAVSLDGTLVNIDGNGNRAAGLIYGPRNVVIIAGVNKLTDNEAAAISRARKTAAPMNAIRLGRHTPCVSTGVCHNCLSDDCVCRHIVITRMSNGENRIKVILVGESLGF